MGGGPIDQQPSTTPTGPRAHTSPLRGLDNTPSSPLFEGRFGRMFRNLPVFDQDEDSLKKLAATMFEPADTSTGDAGGASELDNPEIPAGYTYLGQFIDHDTTFDPASSLQKQNDPDALIDFRTPRFDLDSLYGRGPSDSPFLYDQNPANAALAGKVLLLGNDVGNGRDLQRNGQDRALIGDPRNDENLVVSQLQTVFIRFHNKVVEKVANDGIFDGDSLFKEAQRQVRWHYQWVVVYDFLANHIVDDEVVADILPTEAFRAGEREVELVRPRLLFYHPKNQPFMPVEFSVAAYRFGHSMIRPDYRFNDVVQQEVPIFSDDPNPLANLNGFRPLPQQWGFDWKFFFEVDATHPAQRSRKLDAKLALPLQTLPVKVADHPRSLAERNLIRGMRMALPSGQAVARHMGLEPLSDDDLAFGELASDFADNAPLWYYLLKEAEILGEGKKLGPVGGRIVAEVLIGLLAGDPLSYLNVEPSWRPTLAVNGHFGMPELIHFALAP